MYKVNENIYVVYFILKQQKTYILNQYVYNNHCNQIVKIIIDYYMKLRMYHFLKWLISVKNVRKTFNKTNIT